MTDRPAGRVQSSEDTRPVDATARVGQTYEDLDAAG
jgi:hypothetical protein